MFDLKESPHKRLNILTGEWVLVSPHRMKRPWQGKVEQTQPDNRPSYDENCYLCPDNKRAEGVINPSYTEPYSFVNDFSALLAESSQEEINQDDLLVAKGESGICKVICFSPRHVLTLPEMAIADIVKIVTLWKNEFIGLSQNSAIKYIQIFENKGDVMGCSNPHPHGQIWASSSVPAEIEKEALSQKKHYDKTGKSLLACYLSVELIKKERIVVENEHFVTVVPFWAVWPFETMVISKRHFQTIAQISAEESASLAALLKELTIRYDNLFETSFPYSAGMHQAVVNADAQPYWHWHMHFYPPLLRSATVKKFMVGYEMLANPQRDVTPEWAAEKLRSMPCEHYKTYKNKNEKN